MRNAYMLIYEIPSRGDKQGRYAYLCKEMENLLERKNVGVLDSKVITIASQLEWWVEFIDPAFANLDPRELREQILAINAAPGGRGRTGIATAAAELAVSVGAFGFDKLKGDHDQKVAKARNRLQKAWTVRGKRRSKPTATKPLPAK